MKRIGKHLLILSLIAIAVIIGILQWLKWYTHHGEELILPDYIDKPLVQAENDAADRNFEIVVTDSIFLVGRPGGIIYDQNPKPGSKVKRKRKIYTIVTKSGADMIKVAKSTPTVRREIRDQGKRTDEGLRSEIECARICLRCRPA